MDSERMSTSSASFYESPFEYQEENTTLLYQNIRMTLQNIVKNVVEVDNNLKDMDGEIMTTAKLLNAIKLKSKPNED